MIHLTFDDIRNKGLLQYEFMRGSHAHGLATAESDEDYGGMYMAPAEQLIGLGLDYQEQVENDSHDIVWYELNKFMRLLLKSNPTMLEALFVDDKYVLFETPLMKEIKAHRDLFLSQECIKTAYQYGRSQIVKARGLKKKIVNPMTERKWPLDFCYTFHKQGSSNIRNWLEYRGLKQRYCGLVNIPNMHDVLGCYYDWGMHFQEEGVTYDMLREAYEDGTVYDTIAIVREWKSATDKVEKTKWENLLHRAQFKNMVNFIIKFYELKEQSNVNGIDYTDDNLEKWYCSQKAIGYAGIVREDGKSNEIRLSSVSKGEKPICWLSYNKDGYSEHCREWKEYQEWVEKRNPVRFKLNEGKQFDRKNMCECFRLMQMGIEIARGDGFIVDRTNIDREFLLGIKTGHHEYDELMEMVGEKEKEMQKAIANTKLPEKIDEDLVNDMLLDIRKKQLKLT